MHQIKNIISILTLLLLFACIKPFTPDIESNAENKYVVSGMITDEEGWHEVTVALSSPIENPEYIPLSGCQVQIKDDKGNSFQLNEYGPGTYHIWLGGENLVPGTSFMVRVTTPSGEIIESSYDKMEQGPPLDSVYYIIEEIPTTNPEVFLMGMQFYVDLHAENITCRNFKYEVVQTYEYHAAHPFEYYYDGEFHQIDPPDYSNKVCWITGQVKNVYTLSTVDLSQNAYFKFPLHFVDGHTQRLGILYSILVRQLALSDEAFYYWEQIRVNSHELGGLYEKQPYAIKGNLINLTHPEKDVLGYFFAASESSRRYFYQDIEGLELDFDDFCYEEPLGRMGWREFFPRDYPVYYCFTIDGLRILNPECIDCRLLGGTTTKPDFWP